VTFNPYDTFATPASAAPPGGAERDPRRTSTLAALNTPAGRAWIQARLTEELARPSYVPGTSHDHAAYAEGRKAVLREIAAELFNPPQT
jgi:hypothetical protein